MTKNSVFFSARKNSWELLHALTFADTNAYYQFWSGTTHGSAGKTEIIQEN